MATLSKPRLWNRDEYYRMGELGLISPEEHVELIEGEVIEKMSPIGSFHRVAVYQTAHRLEQVFGPQFYVEKQSPITLSDASEPEPDVFVAVGTVRNYRERHPIASDLRLVVEVSDSTLQYDRTRKAMLYANAAIDEYWIVNLVDSRLEVYRDSTPMIGYRNVTIFLETDHVTPRHASNTQIAVSDLLP